MNTNFPKRRNIRANWWDYCSRGTYFITINTKGRFHYFGEIEDKEMTLTKVGELANTCWKLIPKHYPHVEIDEHIFMPDHMHGIIRVNAASNDKRRSLGAIIGSYKSAVTKEARMLEPGFGWQSRFYDRIIRTEEEYWNTINYIKSNPQRW